MMRAARENIPSYDFRRRHGNFARLHPGEGRLVQDKWTDSDAYEIHVGRWSRLAREKALAFARLAKATAI